MERGQTRRAQRPEIDRGPHSPSRFGRSDGAARREKYSMIALEAVIPPELKRVSLLPPLVLARRGLLCGDVLAIAGSAFGLLFAWPHGIISGFEVWLVASCLVFSLGLFVALMTAPLERLSPIAITATSYYAFYLCAGAINSIVGVGEHYTLLVYLIWFFSLLALNKFVNVSKPALILDAILFAAPLVILAASSPLILATFPLPLQTVLVVFCLAHIACALMMNMVWRYREAFIAEQERFVTLKAASAILESIADGFYTLDREWRFTYFNAAAERMLRRKRDDLFGKVFWDEFPASTGPGLIRQHFDRALRENVTVAFESYYAPVDIWVSTHVYPSAEGVSVYFQDITEQRLALKALHESERRLAEQAALLDKANDAIMVCGIDQRVLYWNRSAERLFGWTSGEVVGRLIQEILAIDSPQTEDALAKVLEHGEWSGEIRHKNRHGQNLVVESRWTLVRGDSGEAHSILSINADISARVAIEQRLQQAERLKAVGQLTGGVAHDFNNLLTVITGNTEILVEELAGDRDLQELAATIGGAAKRGAALTRRLLTFAQRQTLEPRSVDLVALLLQSRGLLRRAMPETIDIEFVKDPKLWPALVDPGQLEDAMLNLCLNARDAMPDGGRLTIEVANTVLDQDFHDRNPDVAVGDYVMVAVTDTGTGIKPENLNQVFDPFFTTKEFGKGTGLGLSMVYGFIKQSRGHVSIYSEPGLGVSVKMYLPRAATLAERAEDAVAPLSELRGSETILVVEDDDLVRRNVARQLTALGYQAITAASGQAAMDVLRSDAPIDLLFTDVIMPGGMNGSDLAAAARTLRPDLRLLFTSGYTEDAIVRSGRLDPGLLLLNKPYPLIELARKTRAALAGADQ
jgi:PAS domain S-box-containing protein